MRHRALASCRAPACRAGRWRWRLWHRRNVRHGRQRGAGAATTGARRSSLRARANDHVAWPAVPLRVVAAAVVHPRRSQQQEWPLHGRLRQRRAMPAGGWVRCLARRCRATLRRVGGAAGRGPCGGGHALAAVRAREFGLGPARRAECAS
eukprot:1614062-Prymnesium_polylepis.1